VNLQPHQGDEEPEISITSLIDVVLMLLVFFMLSTTFINEANLNIQLPEASLAPEAGNRATLEVVVNASGNYFVNGQPLVNTRPETLRAALLKLAAKQEVALTIRADARSTHQAVVTVMDVAGKLGFSNISIVTVNGEQKP